MLLNLKKLTTVLSNQEIKVIKATARIIPGIAYPETEKVVSNSRNLLFDTLFPQFEKKDKEIKIQQDKNTSNIVLKINSVIFKSKNVLEK